MSYPHLNKVLRWAGLGEVVPTDMSPEAQIDRLLDATKRPDQLAIRKILTTKAVPPEQDRLYACLEHVLVTPVPMTALARLLGPRLFVDSSKFPSAEPKEIIGAKERTELDMGECKFSVAQAVDGLIIGTRYSISATEMLKADEGDLILEQKGGFLRANADILQSLLERDSFRETLDNLTLDPGWHLLGAEPIEQNFFSEQDQNLPLALLAMRLYLKGVIDNHPKDITVRLEGKNPSFPFCVVNIWPKTRREH